MIMRCVCQSCLVVLATLIATAAAELTTAEQECAWEGAGASSSAQSGSGMSALVLGGTGAVGHQIVQQLLSSDQWSRVITLGRREVPLPPGAAGADKLKQVVLNLDNLGNDAAAGDAFRGVDAVFCALGTTRSAAGSAAAFKKVDYEYVAAAAAAAKAANVPYFGLVTAQGASASVPASDFVLLHPLLYTQTKGKAEEVVKGSGFSRAAIFRPGILKRGDKARAWERIVSPFGIPVSDVARAMILDAEAFRRGEALGGSSATFADHALRRSAASGKPPQP